MSATQSSVKGCPIFFQFSNSDFEITLVVFLVVIFLPSTSACKNALPAMPDNA